MSMQNISITSAKMISMFNVISRERHILLLGLEGDGYQLNDRPVITSLWIFLALKWS